MSQRRINRRISILAAAVCLLTLPTLAVGQEEPAEVEERDSVVEGRNCISSRSIRRTEVLDDQNILFYLRGATIFLNHLPEPCKRLAKEGRFMYRTSVARLCRLDLFNILMETGSGLGPGRTCKLGSFYAITKEDVEAIKKPVEVAAKPIPPAEPEEPGTGDTSDVEQAEQQEQSEIEKE